MARTRYPRKLRQKLQTIAARRDRRERDRGGDAAVSDANAAFAALADTLWHELLPPGSAAYMLAVIDERRQRISLRLGLRDVRVRTAYLPAQPPWDNQESPPPREAGLRRPASRPALTRCTTP